MRQARDNPRDNPQDNRMAPKSWWFLALMTLLTFGVFCLITRSWTPLADGWPVIAVLFALAAIRQGADFYEHDKRRRDGLGRQHAPHV